MKFLAIGLLLSFCVAAEVHQHTPPPDQTKVDLAKVPPPEHIDGIGEAHIAITTKMPEVQRWFDQGLALMHCFWDYEALRAFAQAAKLDPDCAMCHWGISQALEFRGAEDQAKEEIKKAKQLSEHTSDREQRIIGAFADSSEKTGDDAQNALQKGLAVLVDRYPEDIEIRLLMAENSGGGYEKGEPHPGAIYKQAMLREILRDHPDNAAANHYWVHAVEASDHPDWALESAKKLAALAPGSGHMVHMPGHIFYRVGDYERARQSFLESKRVDEAYMAREHVAVANDWNYAHNLSYLVADCAEEGRYTEALEHARSLIGLANDPDHSVNPHFYVMQIASTETRLAIRFGDWDHAIEHPMQFGVSDDKLNIWARGYRDGLVAYARGMKAAEQGSPEAAQAESNTLDALLWRLSQEKLEDKGKSRRDFVLKILGAASLELQADVTSQRLERAQRAECALCAKQGDFEAARRLFDRAQDAEADIGYWEPPMYARPVLEVLGAACIRAGKFDQAREAYRKALAKRPHSGFALYGIALAWDKQGDKQHAADAYREFLRAWSHADEDLPQIKAARAYLAGM